MQKKGNDQSHESMCGHRQQAIADKNMNMKKISCCMDGDNLCPHMYVMDHL